MNFPTTGPLLATLGYSQGDGLDGFQPL